MRIDVLRSSEDTDLHIWSRHRVTYQEVLETANAYRLVIRGRSDGIYELFGRTDAGRYLAVAIRYLGKGVARLITARDMDWTERRRYERHSAH